MAAGMDEREHPHPDNWQGFGTTMSEGETGFGDSCPCDITGKCHFPTKKKKVELKKKVGIPWERGRSGPLP